MFNEYALLHFSLFWKMNTYLNITGACTYDLLTGLNGIDWSNPVLPVPLGFKIDMFSDVDDSRE